MTEDPGLRAAPFGTERALADVAHRTGGLGPDEHACVYGAALARQLALGSPETTAPQADALAHAIVAFRSAPCSLCRKGITEHALDLTDRGASVRCLCDQATTPVLDWLGTRQGAGRGSTALALALWAGLPLVSLGTLSWLMPAIAGGVYRRRSWIIAAILLCVLVAAPVIVPLSVGGGVAGGGLLAAWLGGTLYGAAQVRPWLAERSRPSTVD